MGPSRWPDCSWRAGCAIWGRRHTAYPSYGNTNGYADIGAYAYAHTLADPHAHTDVDHRPFANADTDADAYLHTAADPHAYTNTDPITTADQHAYPRADSHADEDR